MQTLCVLHRFNHGGPASWYPDKIMAMPETKSPRGSSAGAKPQRPSNGPTKADDDAVTDVLC